MVSFAQISAMIFNVIVCFVIPIAVLIAISKKTTSVVSCALAGALGFVVTQIIIRIPLLQILSQSGAFLGWQLIPHSLFLALTAALFETAGRLLVFKTFMKNRQSFYTGLSAGIGHGAIEAMLLVGANYILFLIIAFAINSGSTDGILLSLGISANQIISIVESTPATTFLAAGAERLFTMCFHACASVLLLCFIQNGKTLKGFLIVCAMHTFIDFAVPVTGALTNNIWLCEGILAAAAILCVVLIIKSRPYFKKASICKAPISPINDTENI